MPSSALQLKEEAGSPAVSTLQQLHQMPSSTLQLKEEAGSPEASIAQQQDEKPQFSPADPHTLAYPQPTYPSLLQAADRVSPQQVAVAHEPISPASSGQAAYSTDDGYHSSAFQPVRPQSKSPEQLVSYEVNHSSPFQIQNYEHLKQPSPIQYESSPEYQRISPSYPGMFASQHGSQPSAFWYHNETQSVYEYQQQMYHQPYPAAPVQQYYQQQLSPEMPSHYPAAASSAYQAYPDSSPNSHWNQVVPSMTTPSPPNASFDAMIPSGLCSKCSKVTCTCKGKLKAKAAPLRCRKCRRGFSYSKRLIEHELSCTVQPPYDPVYEIQGQTEVIDLECNGCHKSFKSIRWLEWHKVNKCEVLSSCSSLQSDTSSQSSDLGYQSSSPTLHEVYSPWNSQTTSAATSPHTSILQSSEMTSQPAAQKSRRGRPRKNNVYRASPSSSARSSSESDNGFPTYMKNGKYCCGLCDSAFSFDTNLTRHQRNIHGKAIVRKSRTTTSPLSA